jgi:membrane protease YdiL (CAAX protease family)
MMPNATGRYMPNFAPSQWYMRIARFFAYCLPVIPAFALIIAPLLEPNEALYLGQAFISLAMAAAMIIETMRVPGGSSRASGLIPSSVTGGHIFTGAATATIMMVIIALAAIAAGARVQYLDVTIEPFLVLGLAISSMGEEVLFRGTIMQALQQRFGTYVSVVVTSALFAAVHLGNPHVEPLAIVSTFMVGLLFGMMTVLTSSLWMAMSFHAVWNLLSAGIFGEVSGLTPVWQFVDIDTTNVRVPQWIFGGSYGIESGVITIVHIVAAFAVVPKYCRLDPFARAARYRIDVWHPSHNQQTSSSSY